MITEEIRTILTHEGMAGLATSGPDGAAHLVATWMSYIEVMEDGKTLTFPAGRYRVTEANVKASSPLQMIVGAKMPKGVGYRLTGRAEFQSDTDLHRRVKERFPWCRAAVVLHVEKVEKVLG